MVCCCRVCLDIGIACFFANLCIVFYLTVWLPYVQKVTLPWDIYCPRMIPAATAIGALCGVMYVVLASCVGGLLMSNFLLCAAVVCRQVDCGVVASLGLVEPADHRSAVHGTYLLHALHPVAVLDGPPCCFFFFRVCIVLTVVASLAHIHDSLGC